MLAGHVLQPSPQPVPAPRPMSNLAPHFALLGGATAWAVLGALGEFPFNAIESDAVAPATVLSAAFGAVMGVVVTQLFCPVRAPKHGLGDDRSLAWLAPIVLVVAAAAGLFVGATQSTGYRGDKAAAEGFALGIALAPLPLAWAAWVTTRARRASRARQGSLVGDADERSVWSATLAAASLVSAIAMAERVAVVGARSYNTPGPSVFWFGSFAVAVFAAAALFGLTPLELAARRRIAGLLREARDGSITESDDAQAQAPRDGAPDLLDTGLGEGVMARVEHARDAYRDRARVTAVVRGSVTEAAETLASGRAAHFARLALAGSVLGLHVLATTFGRGDEAKARVHERGTTVVAAVDRGSNDSMSELRQAFKARQRRNK